MERPTCARSRIRQISGPRERDWSFKVSIVQTLLKRLVRADAPTVHGTAASVFFQIVSSMAWCRNLRGMDVSCVFLRKIHEKLKVL